MTISTLTRTYDKSFNPMNMNLWMSTKNTRAPIIALTTKEYAEKRGVDWILMLSVACVTTKNWTQYSNETDIFACGIQGALTDQIINAAGLWAGMTPDDLKLSEGQRYQAEALRENALVFLSRMGRAEPLPEIPVPQPPAPKIEPPKPPEVEQKPLQEGQDTKEQEKANSEPVKPRFARTLKKWWWAISAVAIGVGMFLPGPLKTALDLGIKALKAWLDSM